MNSNGILLTFYMGYIPTGGVHIGHLFRRLFPPVWACLESILLMGDILHVDGRVRPNMTQTMLTPNFKALRFNDFLHVFISPIH